MYDRGTTEIFSLDANLLAVAYRSLPVVDVLNSDIMVLELQVKGARGKLGCTRHPLKLQ